MAKGVAELKHEVFETNIREASQNQSKTQTQKSDRTQIQGTKSTANLDL
jgi:hypothetical protein